MLSSLLVDAPYFIVINIELQQMSVYQYGQFWRTYAVSTAKNGVGERAGSECTPRGLHIIRAKIGAHALPNAVFVGRRFTGETYSDALAATNPGRDWILTRILWLSGCELGKNRLGSLDTMRRYIYIHGTPDNVQLGQPGSHGCIRMHNEDIIELFDHVPVYTKLLISESYVI